MKHLLLCVFAALILTISFSGCASTTLYSWGSYESQVYSYLQGGSRGDQLTVLENDLQKIEKDGKTVPPGFYAHLGLLYADAGNESQAVSCFLTEKNRFPESAPFMDFLLRRYNQ